MRTRSVRGTREAAARAAGRATAARRAVEAAEAGLAVDDLGVAYRASAGLARTMAAELVARTRLAGWDDAALDRDVATVLAAACLVEATWHATRVTGEDIRGLTAAELVRRSLAALPARLAADLADLDTSGL